MQELNRRGYTLALTTLGYELVDLETGEIGLRGRVPSIYEQHPSSRLLREQGDRIAALVDRQGEEIAALKQYVAQHQADHIVQETPGAYSV